MDRRTFFQAIAAGFAAAVLPAPAAAAPAFIGIDPGTPAPAQEFWFCVSAAFPDDEPIEIVWARIRHEMVEALQAKLDEYEVQEFREPQMDLAGVDHVYPIQVGAAPGRFVYCWSPTACYDGGDDDEEEEDRPGIKIREVRSFSGMLARVDVAFTGWKKPDGAARETPAS